jgi:hypothetical protein
MAHSAPLIQRLQLHQGKTRRMLTPVKKDPTGQHHPFTAGLNAWGTQKYSQIVENMRFLREERLGNFSPQKINRIGIEIPSKFADPVSLLHLKPANAQSNSIWSEVEQALPAGEPAAPDAKIPRQETGVMRAGTVIQRMPTVPRPGQSIESFKEQIQARATTKPKAPVRIPPRPNDPSIRRYARIEEIPPKPTVAYAEESSNSDSPPEMESAPNDTIHRQPEPSVDMPFIPEHSAPQPKTTPKPLAQSPKPPARVSETSPRPKPPTDATEDEAPPLSRDPEPSGNEDQAAATPTKPEKQIPPKSEPAAKLEKPAQTPIPQPPPPATKPPQTPPPQASDTDEIAALPRLSFSQRKAIAPETPSPQRKAIAPETPSPQKMPPHEKVLPRARPRPRRVEPAAEAPDQALPQAKATPRPQPQLANRLSVARAEPRKPTAVQPKISGLIAPVLQRQPDSTGTTPPPQPGSKQTAEMPTSPQQVLKTTVSDDSLPTQPTEPFEQASQAAPAHLDMPVIKYRREAPGQVRILKAESIKPVFQAEVFMPSQPLIQRSSESSRPETKSKMPQVGENFPGSRTQAALPVRPDALPQGAPQPAQETILMPVAHLPQPALAMTSQSATPPQQSPVFEPAPPPASLPETTPAPIKTTAKNVVQRLWDDHSPPASAQGQGSRSNTASDESSQTGSGLDLDKIAEEVLPIVKRLIEIESERSAGYLR